MSSGRTTPCVGARPSTRSSPKMPCSTSPGASTVAATRSIAWQAQSRLLTLTFDISQLPCPRNWSMAGGSNGYLAPPLRRQLTQGQISSLRRTAGSPLFISFSTSYGELDSAVRRPMLRIGKRREEYFAVAQAALLEAKHRKSIGNPGEKLTVLCPRSIRDKHRGPLHCFVSPASRKFRINATVSVGRSSISQCPEPTTTAS